MRSTRRPPHRLERTLVLVLVGFIAVDLLLVLPAFASELRLDRLHSSLPIVNLRPLAAGRARIADGLGEEFTAPVRELAGELEQAGAKFFNAVLYEVNSASEDGQGNSEAAFPLAPSATPTPIPDFEPEDKSAPTQTQVTGDSSPEPSPSSEATLDPDATVLPSPTVDSFETAVAQTATALALPKKTKLPPPTKTPGPSYTPTSTSAPTEQMPSLTPTQKIVATATLVCAVAAPGCETAPAPSFTPTDVPSPTLAPTHTPLPTTAPTNTTLPTPVPTHSGPIPAFPGAEGWGAGSVGGRGGRVIEVTNLNDSGPGSLRDAIDASGPRMVVFRVGGVIRLQSELSIKQPYITLAGQTAPGTGIILADDRMIIQTHDVIIRYLRWRGGISFVTLRPWGDMHNVIVDHCSATWGEDDIVDIWFGPETAPDMRNVTIQNCLIAEPLAVHPTGMMAGTQLTEAVDYIDRLHNISIHHNLFAHIGYRNPRIKAQGIEVINNVVYNWGNRIGGTARASEVDWIRNYFKAGPMTENDPNSYLRHESVNHDGSIVYPTASIFVSGNVVPERGFSDLGADNWWMYTEYAGPNYGETIAPTHRRDSPMGSAPFPVSIQSPYDAYDFTISNAGADARLDSLGNWISNRDSVDQRLLSDVVNSTGPSSYLEIQGPGTIGAIDSGTPYPDSDHDGMPDEWERLYCFNPDDSSDGPANADGDGYTNIEEFLNGTHPGSGGGC